MVRASSDELSPEDFLQFVETNEFVRQWDVLGFDCEHDLLELQLAIMRDPHVGKVVAGTGGLRKMRFGRAKDGVGKRGGIRVCYIHFPGHAIVLLVTAYGKDEKDDLTASDKKGIREFIDRSKAALDRSKGR